ncbi:MAG: gluconolactonase [Actinomycetota bacterium]|jgi:gluconolactonase
MKDARIVTDGLRFPEGPVVLPDGSVIVVEINAGRVSRVTPDGTITVVAETGGGPNGAALGPDGKLYVCNDGGFAWTDLGFVLLPFGEHGVTEPDDYVSGSIQRVDIGTGVVETLYTECDGVTLKGPNDIVFDTSGGFWFTDHGKVRLREEDRGGVYYAAADGSSIREVIFPLHAPNGIGLSPDGARLYVAETHTGRLWAWDVTGPGAVAKASPVGAGGTLVAGLPGYQLFDSLGVEADGNVCVATLAVGGISVISPDGDVEHVPLPEEFADGLTTNICWGGEDMRTAYVTLSGSGRLLTCEWPRPGLRLAY